MLVRFFILLAVLIVNSGLAMASEGFDGGLPQFNISSFPEQAFWLLIIFFILYAFLVKFVIPRIKSIKHIETESNKYKKIY